MTSPRVSVIIRTRNEETWIGHCLDMVFRQDYPDFEVIVVDNASIDHTLQVAARYPVAKVLSIDAYLPGQSLNQGIRAASGPLIACLSAHCIPQHENWLSKLVSGFLADDIAGVYGRQLPLAFSTAFDKRDLLTVFGLDRRIQTRDYFFHNANSIIRRDLWQRFPFDETLTNIEDRHWGKAVINAGFRLVYEPEAAVYHHHGINQNGNAERASGVSTMLDLLEQDLASSLPDSLKPENCHIAAVVPVLGEPRDLQGADLLTDILRQLKAARYVRTIHTFGESETVRATAARNGVHHIARPQGLQSRDKTLGEILAFALGQIERGGVWPQVMLYVNYLCPFRPANLFDELVTELQYKGMDSVFPGYIDYNDHWVSTAPGKSERISESHRPGPNQPTLYRSLYGLGCATKTEFIRRGRMIGDRVSVVPLHEHLYTLRCTDSRPEVSLTGLREGISSVGWTAELFLREFRP
ncbi:rhamnosyltransferase [uncultured Gammaproteobacteria bacterium]